LIGKLEVCELLGISKRQLERWVVMGIVPYVRVENELRFDEQQILSWISSKDLIPRKIEDFRDKLLIMKMGEQKRNFELTNHYLNLRKILSLVEQLEADPWAYREEIIEETQERSEEMSYAEKFRRFNEATEKVKMLDVESPGFSIQFEAGRAEVEKWKQELKNSSPGQDQIESEKVIERKKVYAVDELSSLIVKTFKEEKT